MSTRIRIITSVVLLATLLATVLLSKFSWLYAVAVFLAIGAMLLQPAIKLAIVDRARKLGVPFKYTEGPYVLFRDEKIDIRTASNVLGELLDVFMESTDLSPTVPKGSLSVLTWQILAGGHYSVDPAYIRMHRENKKRRDTKYMSGV